MKAENAIAIKYNKDFLVIQANELVRSKQSELSLLETKLIRLAVAQILKGDKDFLTYSCKLTDLADFLGLKYQNVYRDVQELTENIMGKHIYILDKNSKNKD